MDKFRCHHHAFYWNTTPPRRQRQSVPWRGHPLPNPPQQPCFSPARRHDTAKMGEGRSDRGLYAQEGAARRRNQGGDKVRTALGSKCRDPPRRGGSRGTWKGRRRRRREEEEFIRMMDTIEGPRVHSGRPLLHGKPGRRAERVKEAWGPGVGH